ncbi:MAG: class I SAM-dependent methyltransferase [Deltaproteobacteria bacterium]|nr:class I SAM-dependent methyltransferase [Deltaproteobacteria bacterium]
MIAKGTEILDLYDCFAEWYDLLYLAQGVKKQAFNPKTVEAFDTLFRELGVERILDCACGTGDPILGLFRLDNRPYQVVGSDGSGGMLSICRKNAEKEGIYVSESIHESAPSILPLVQCTWNDLDFTFGDERFDLVMCRGHGLYHLITREAIVNALRKIARITTEGGWVLFDTVRWKLGPDKTVCGEEGRDHVKWRGWIDLKSNPDLRLPPGSAEFDKLLFVDVTNFRPDEKAAGRVVQTKTVFVLGERGDELQQLDRLSALGAAFSSEEGKSLLEEAGLKDVHEFESKEHPVLRHWTIIMGRKS